MSSLYHIRVGEPPSVCPPLPQVAHSRLVVIFVAEFPIKGLIMTEPAQKIAKMASSLQQLKDVTTVVADTGDFEGE